jgi:hypothetical protein
MAYRDMTKGMLYFATGSLAYLRRRKAIVRWRRRRSRNDPGATAGVCDVAQETYKVPEVQWWGLPVGLTFIVSAIAATFYVNLGYDSFLNGVIGAIALPMLGLGIVSLGAFIYSIIAHNVGKTEAKRFIPESAH